MLSPWLDSSRRRLRKRLTISHPRKREIYMCACCCFVLGFIVAVFVFLGREGLLFVCVDKLGLFIKFCNFRVE